jgi:hypothetical protein
MPGHRIHGAIQASTRRIREVMDYYNLKAIVEATKQEIVMSNPSESFYVAESRDAPYIPPTFVKAEFEGERPSVILVSAVGATGKSTLAHVVSYETRLPLLDLAKHKPVGDTTLTGLLTRSFPTAELSDVFQGIAEGRFGVIIDGIDEGRAKTREEAFAAFLEDIGRLCQESSNTSFVLLGRTQILEECWLQLTDQGVSAGLLTIAPFDLASARDYVDAFTDAIGTPYETQYVKARDRILDLLGNAFRGVESVGEEEFFAFIGYPPVLDAIATLLKRERNFHRLLERLDQSGGVDMEVSLLLRIAQYILARERDEKVVPNILEPLLAELGELLEEADINEAFGEKEQCQRVVAYCLGKEIELDVLGEDSLNREYEERIATCLADHPFLQGRAFRNAVFESMALATLMAADSPDCSQLVLEYVSNHKHSYHLVYLLDQVAPSGCLPIVCLSPLLGAAQEFRSHTASVELRVEGCEQPEGDVGLPQTRLVDIEVSIIMGVEGSPAHEFSFRASLPPDSEVRLGSRMAAGFISVPAVVVLSGNPEIELTAPIEIEASRLRLEGTSLILRHAAKEQPPDHIVLEAEAVESRIQDIITSGVTLTVPVSDKTGLTYPLIRYVAERTEIPADPQLKEKYHRLRRILQEFRSHGRGSLGKYRFKIEHERVLRNEIGKAILARLLHDGILTREGDMYILHQEEVSKHMGISWLDLRQGKASDQLLAFLRSIEV